MWLLGRLGVLMLDLADECCDGAQAMHDFTARCLERNAGARPTPAQLLKHPFLERVRDISYLARALLGGALQQPMPSSKSFVLSSDGTQASPVSKTSPFMVSQKRCAQAQQHQRAPPASWPCDQCAA